MAATRHVDVVATQTICIIGSDGFIGSNLYELASRNHTVYGTSRRSGAAFPLDLLRVDDVSLPHADVSFLCAAVANYRLCEGNAEAWRINVDGTLAVAKRLMRAGSFVVFLSSVAAEWATHSAYGRAKAIVECTLQAMGDPAIIRFERVTPITVETMVSRVLGIGLARRPGIFRL